MTVDTFVMRYTSAATEFESLENAIHFFVQKHARPGEAHPETPSLDALVAEDLPELQQLHTQWRTLPAPQRMPRLEATIAGILQRERQHEPEVRGLRAGVRSSTLLKNTSSITSLKTGHLLAPVEIPHRNIEGEINWVLVDEQSLTVRVIDKDYVDRTGGTFDELLASTLANDPPAPISDWASVEDQIFSPSPPASGSVAAQILHAGESDSLPFDGPAVVFLPTTATAIVVPATDPEAVARAGELTAHFIEPTHHLSLQPLVNTGARWHRLRLTSDHPAYSACSRLAKLDKVAAHDLQREHLARTLPDIHIAASHTAASETTAVTVTSISCGSPTLVPQTDVVAVVRCDGPSVFVAWEHFSEILGSKLEATDHYPTRWRLAVDPTARELAALRRVEISVEPS